MAGSEQTRLLQKLGGASRRTERLLSELAACHDLNIELRGRVSMLARENEAMQQWALWAAERIVWLETRSTKNQPDRLESSK